MSHVTVSATYDPNFVPTRAPSRVLGRPLGTPEDAGAGLGLEVRRLGRHHLADVGQAGELLERWRSQREQHALVGVAPTRQLVDRGSRRRDLHRLPQVVEHPRLEDLDVQAAVDRDVRETSYQLPCA